MTATMVNNRSRTKLLLTSDREHDRRPYRSLALYKRSHLFVVFVYTHNSSNGEYSSSNGNNPPSLRKIGPDPMKVWPQIRP